MFCLFLYLALTSFFFYIKDGFPLLTTEMVFLRDIGDGFPLLVAEMIFLHNIGDGFPLLVAEMVFLHNPEMPQLLS